MSVSARDDDQTGSVNAQVLYSLIDGDVDYFSIDPQLGDISNQVVLVSLLTITVIRDDAIMSLYRTVNVKVPSHSL